MIKTGKFSCQASQNTVQLDNIRLLLVFTGLYLPLVFFRSLTSRLYIRQQLWSVDENNWTCEETGLLLGSIKYQRTLHIPTSSIVYRSVDDGGDPALVLSGTVWMFILVLLGAAHIHTGLSASSVEMLLYGIFYSMLGLAIHISCVLVHQLWMRQKTWQIVLIDGSVWTMVNPIQTDLA